MPDFTSASNSSSPGSQVSQTLQPSEWQNGSGAASSDRSGSDHGTIASTNHLNGLQQSYAPTVSMVSSSGGAASSIAVKAAAAFAKRF